ncbi:MAG: glycosyltransferase family 4 protein, partial [Gemmatimonadaceae bacterium]|nr:glycosyltransferase family 4 protein [Acetobacteraceae bacterium]
TWASLVAFELHARGHAVTVVRAENAIEAVGAPLKAPALPAPGRVLVGRDMSGAVLATQQDAIVYALGNHFGYHSEIPRLLAEAPGVVVLHDAEMSGFLHFWHALSPRGTVPGPGTPLLPWFAARATGAVVHSRFYAEGVRAACTGQTRVLQLAFFDLDVAPPRRRRPQSRLVIATIGEANPNKRHEAVIDAIGLVPALCAGTTYRVLGHASPARQAELQSRADALGVEIEFKGWLTLDDLRTAVAETDVLCCLRWPVTEGASGSAALALLSGRPVMVPDVGSFIDLPDEFVLRVPAGNETPTLAGYLLTLFHHPEIGERRGSAARAWARETFLVTHYVDRLLPLLHQATAAAPMIALMRGFEAEAASFGLPPDDPLIMRSRTTAERSFGLIDPSRDR